MKILSTLIVLLFFVSEIFAQPNVAFNYQGVARDQSGEVLSNQEIGLRIKILQNGMNEQEGTVVYVKYYAMTTNQFGLINLEINEEDVLYGALDGLEWNIHDFYLQVELDLKNTGDCNQLSGGENCKLMGASKLLAVPYAMYAAKAGSLEDGHWLNAGGHTIHAQSNNIGIGTYEPLQKLDLRGGLFMSGTGFSNANSIKNIPALNPNHSDFYLLTPTLYEGAHSDLRLFIEDDAEDRFSIYGNSCNGGGCNDLANSQVIATFLGNGRLGLGVATPKSRLHNIGDYYGRGHVFLHAYEGDGTDGTAYLQARDDSDSSNIGLRLRTQNAGRRTEAVHISPDGKVGINHTTPTARFTIRGDTSNDLTLKVLNNALDQGIAFQNSGNAYTWNIFRRAAGNNTADLIFSGNDTDPQNDIKDLNPYLTLKAEGNIGIGTENPAAKVQVKDGDIYLEDISGGIIMTSPNGTCWRVTIGNNGEFERALVECPN